MSGKHYTGELTKETSEAVAANTDHCVTGYYFYKFLQDGIKVGKDLLPIQVRLVGEFAKKQGMEDKLITVKPDGFFDELGNKVEDILTINCVIADVGFKFGIRFKWAVDGDKAKMYVN